MQKIRTHYDNLKVARNAPIEVIRASYKTLSQKHHPDRNEGSSESQRVMTIINVSYAALSDPEQRKIHDAWIQQQESFNSYDEQPTKNSDSIDFSLPTSGEINFYDLEENVKTKIKDRASGVNRNQYSIKLDGVAWNYLWTIILFGWFYYIYTSSFEYRWSTETTYWHIGLTVTVGFLLAMNISWIYSWHSHPLKSWLIITPLYLMKLHLDKIIYWPIWTVSDIKATHNYKNGSYQNTSLSITLDGKNELFSIPSEEAYQEFLHRLNEYDQKFRMAANENNIDYFIDNDEFFNIARKNNKSEKKSNSLKIIYAFLAAFSFVFLALSYTYNQERPIKPIHSNNNNTYSGKPQSQISYSRPKTAPNGSAWPTYASYLANYPILNTNGLSSVTVDNTQNNSDVFVKLTLITANKSFPIRFFYIPAYGKFKIDNIDAGLYDIRYRDLVTGGLARSESFALEEITTHNGTQYSDMTMTLYKVRNGNMQTYGLSEDEF